MTKTHLESIDILPENVNCPLVIPEPMDTVVAVDVFPNEKPFIFGNNFNDFQFQHYGEVLMPPTEPVGYKPPVAPPSDYGLSSNPISSNLENPYDSTNSK